MQEIRSLNPPVVTESYDPNNTAYKNEAFH